MILEKLEIQFTANVSGALKNINALKKAASGTKSADKVKVDADTAKAEKKLKAVSKQVKNIPDGDVDVTADTSEAEGKLKAVAKQAQSLPDADIDVTADTTAAERQLKSVAKQANELPDAKITVKVDSAEAEKQLRDGGSGLFMAGGIKGAAIVGGAVTLGKGGYDLAETAYGAQSAQNRLEILLPEEAVTRVERYSRAMYDLYGLNETATKSRVTNFASVFRGIGVETGTAVEYAERMSDAAIDYASALDKTPQEVTDIMMSLMRGNTAVADNIGLFGLTVDKLNKKAEELEAEGLMPENIDEESRKYIALLHILEENADVQGFTGDWARTSDEFGNQVSILGEQWQTLKEKAGALLLPAANWIVGGLNDILNAISGFGLEEQGFQKQIEGYFGGVELTEESINDIVEKATGPTKQIVSGIKQAQADLDAAFTTYEAAYFDFWNKMNTIWITGAPVTPGLEEELAASWDYLETTLIDGENSLIRTQRDAIITYINSLNAMTGFQWNSAAENGVKAVDGYFSKMEARAMELSNEMSALMRQVFEDGIITDEEWQMIQQKNTEIAKFNAEKITIQNKARMQRIADEGAGITHGSASELMKLLLEESSATKKEIDTAYSATKDWYYTNAAEQQAEYEKDPAAYIEKYGSAPLSAVEQMKADGIDQMYSAAIAAADAEIADVIGKTYIAPLNEGLEKELSQMDENTTNQEFFERYMMPLFSNWEVYDMFSNILSNGGTLSPENMDFYNRYTAAAAMLPPGITPGMLAITEDPFARKLVAESLFLSGESGAYSEYMGQYGSVNAGEGAYTYSDYLWDSGVKKHVLRSFMDYIKGMFSVKQEHGVVTLPDEPFIDQPTPLVVPEGAILQYDDFSGYEDMEISYPVVEDFVDNSSNGDVLGDETSSEMLTAAETQKTASEEFMSGVAEFRSAIASGFTVYVKGQSYGTYESGVHGGRATNMADRVMMVK